MSRSLLHDQLLFNNPTGETVTKAIDLANYRSGNINLLTVEASELILNQLGDNIAVAVAVRIIGNYLGQDMNSEFRELRVWKHFQGNWPVIAGSVVAVHN